MGKLTKFMGGILGGAVVGAAMALLLAPDSAESLRNRVRAEIAAIQEQARQAAEEQRRALEAELERLRSGQAGKSM